MIVTLFCSLLTYSLPFALLLALMKRNAGRWNRIAHVYPADDQYDCVVKRTMQTVIFDEGKLRWNSYKGIVTVGVTRQGILLRIMRPFSIFHSPILIPFRDCQVEPRRWYLIGKTVQYTLQKAGDNKIIIHDETQDWIESQVATLLLKRVNTRLSNDEPVGLPAIG